PATPEPLLLSLHDALPISGVPANRRGAAHHSVIRPAGQGGRHRGPYPGAALAAMAPGLSEGDQPMNAPFVVSDYQTHLNRVSKQFGERQVLDNINLRVPQGQFVAIVGRGGCGKSTLLRLVAGLEEASGGYLGLHFRESGDKRSQVRMMFQDSRLLPWKSVLDNVLLGTRGFNLARHALEEVGLWDRRDEWPSRLSGV